MMDKLKKLMEQKKGRTEMSPMHKDAKMSMLKALHGEMSGMIKDELQKPGMKKVEVQSSDAEGLAHGLDKAKELLGAADEGSNSDQLGQDEEGEHAVDAGSRDMWDVSPEMEEEAEEGDSEEPEHEGEMSHDDSLSAEEEEMLAKLLAKKGKK